MKQQPDQARTLNVLWMANLTAVMIIGGVIKFLPEIIEVNSLPAVQMPMLVLAALSVPLAFYAGRLMGVGEPPAPSVPGRRAETVGKQKELSRFAIAGTLAELPAMLGLVYAMVGGDTLYGLAFAAASMVAMFTLRPE